MITITSIISHPAIDENVIKRAIPRKLIVLVEGHYIIESVDSTNEIIYNNLHGLFES